MAAGTGGGPLDALLGNVWQDDEELELMGGINFKSPLKATLNLNTKRLDLALAASVDMPTIDPRIYGLVVGADDGLKGINQNALAQAFAAANALGGGVIQLPRGVIYTTPVGIPYSNIHIRGAGRKLTKVVLGAAVGGVDQDEVFRFGIPTGSGTPVAVSCCSIGSMEIDGNRSNQVNGSDPAGSNAAAVGVVTVTDMTIFDLDVHDCDGYGISFYGTNFPGRSDWYVYEVHTHHNNYDGVDIKGGTTNVPSGIDFDRVWSYDNGPGNIVGRDSVGFDLRGDRITVTKCRADRNSNSGIRCRDGSDGCVSASIVSCWAVGNTGAGFHVDGMATGVYEIVGGRAKGNTQYGCRHESGRLVMQGVELSGQLRGYTNISTAASVILRDCTIQDNTDYGVRVDPTGSSLRVYGGCVRRNGLDGVRAHCGYLDLQDVDILDNDTLQTNHAGVLVAGTVALWRIEKCRITNIENVGGGGTPTQNWAIDFGAAGPGVLASYILGNTAAPYAGNLPNGTRYAGPAGLDAGNTLGADLTIAAGVITVTSNIHAIDTEAAAASDDLDTINGGYPGLRVTLSAKNAARTVVLKDGTGNLSLSGDFSLTDTADRIELVSNGSTWFECSPGSDNAA